MRRESSGRVPVAFRLEGQRVWATHLNPLVALPLSTVWSDVPLRNGPQAGEEGVGGGGSGAYVPPSDTPLLQAESAHTQQVLPVDDTQQLFPPAPDSK